MMMVEIALRIPQPESAKSAPLLFVQETPGSKQVLRSRGVVSRQSSRAGVSIPGAVAIDNCRKSPRHEQSSAFRGRRSRKVLGIVPKRSTGRSWAGPHPVLVGLQLVDGQAHLEAGGSGLRLHADVAAMTADDAQRGVESEPES